MWKYQNTVSCRCIIRVSVFPTEASGISIWDRFVCQRWWESATKFLHIVKQKCQLVEFDISQKFNWYEIRLLSSLSDYVVKELGKQEEFDSYH
jgi:hypothetical protein